MDVFSDEHRAESILAEQRTLPDCCNAPAVSAQPSELSPVPTGVVCDLLAPKVSVGLRQGSSYAVMPVPEATVDEYDRTPPRQDNVGTPGQAFVVKAVTQSARMQGAAQHHFRFGIARLDAAHRKRSLLAAERVVAAGYPIVRGFIGHCVVYFLSRLDSSEVLITGRDVGCT